MRYSIVVALSLLAAGPALAQNQQQNGSASVTLSNGSVTHNVVKSGVKGIELHHVVKAMGLKGQTLEVSCYFRYDDSAAQALDDRNGKFTTPDGKVSVSSREKVQFAESTFKKFTHFMPYTELHLGPGKTKIKARCQAFQSGGLLGASDWLRITFTGGAKKTGANPSAIFTNPRMAHNVMKAGAKGLELRHHLRVQNMEGQPVEVTCHFFYKADGKGLRDLNGKFRTSGGNVSVSDTVTVNFSDATWKGFKHFIPYSELHISTPGKTKLKTRCEAFKAGKSIGIGPWLFVDFNK